MRCSTALCAALTSCAAGSLLKAVTSAKLSATCRYALVGYGVRENGVVADHPSDGCVARCAKPFFPLMLSAGRLRAS